MTELNPYGPKAHGIAFRWPAEDKFITILNGAVRSSKTFALHPKVVLLCRYKVDGLSIFTGVSKNTIYKNVLSHLFDIIGPRNYSYNRSTGELNMFGCTWFVIGAKDEGSEKYIRGETIGRAICDELTLMPRSFFMTLMGRMSPAGARVYATTNPEGPYHWVKSELIDDKGRAGDVEVINFTMNDNPNIDKDSKRRIKSMYKGVYYKRFILGLWVMAEGAVYRDAVREDTYYKNETRPITLKNAGGFTDRCIAIDYGTTNPCVFLDIWDDGKRVWIDREYYWDSREKMQMKTDAQYADDLIRFIAGEDPISGHPNPTHPANAVPTTVICDPSAASFITECASRGIYCIDADNEVEDGIRLCATGINNGVIRINEEECPHLKQELETYCYDNKKAARGVEEPIKAHDHGPDAKRYYVKTRLPEWRLALAA